MCTAITYKSDEVYFGRNLDVTHGYGEKVTVTPRRFPLCFRNGEVWKNHFAIIGMAAVIDGYPLYYDATNEKGLSIAGLSFPDNAVYLPEDMKKINISPFELIPYLLGKCESVDAAIPEIEKINLCSVPFREDIPLTPLHWILADSERAVTIEPRADGIHVYDNPLGVLTNNPPFDYHMYNIVNYMNLTSAPPQNRFTEEHKLHPYSFGMGAFGLPGDLSSASRFVRAAFIKLNSKAEKRESSCVNQFFHILQSVSQPRGATGVGNEEYEYTLYSSCCNASRGIYYYTTYENSRICAVRLNDANADGETLSVYPLMIEWDVYEQ